MVEEADIFSRLDRVEKRIESLFYSDEWLKLLVEIQEIHSLVLQNRMTLAELIIETRLTNTGNLLPGKTIAVLAARREMLRHREWFKGAFRETEHPSDILAEWYHRMLSYLKANQFDILAEEIEQMLPPPKPTEE